MAVQITTGGQGKEVAIYSITSNAISERVEKAAKLLSDAFETDSYVTYIMSSLPLEQRNAYRPKFFSALLTAAAINGATFSEANGWKSCGVLFPPGKDLVSPRTVLLPGSLSAMWTLGFAACRVSPPKQSERTISLMPRQAHVVGDTSRGRPMQRNGFEGSEGLLLHL
jgi:hypothetical protein